MPFSKKTIKKLKRSKKSKTQKTIFQFRNRDFYLKENAKISYIISHGKFIDETFPIPKNIRLFQITDPGKLLYPIDVYGILNQFIKVENNNKLVLNHKIEGKDLKPPPTYKSNKEPYNYYFPVNIGYNFLVTEPGKTTTNLELDFSESPQNDSIYFKNLSYMLPDQTIVDYFEDYSHITTLKIILNDISNYYHNLCRKYDIDSNKYPLDVVQLSCKSGTFYDPDNLAQLFSKISLEEDEITSNCTDTIKLKDLFYLDKLTTNNENLTFDDFIEWLHNNYTPIYNLKKEDMKKYCNKRGNSELKRKFEQLNWPIKHEHSRKKKRLNSKLDSNQMDIVEEN